LHDCSVVKIALVNPITRSQVGGIIPKIVSNREAMIVQTARAITDLGHEVMVYASATYRPEQSDEGVSISYLPDFLPRIFPPAKIPWLQGLTSELVQGGFDAVLASETLQPATLACVRAKSRRQFRLVIWQEMGHFQKPFLTLAPRLYYLTLARWVFARADLFIPRCLRAAIFLLGNGLQPAKLGPIIPHGVAGEIFHPGPRPPSNPGYLLCVGNLMERKGVDVLIRAFAQVAPNFPGLRLILKGAGPLEPVWCSLASSLGMNGRVVFDTQRSNHREMAELYRGTLFAVLPSPTDLLPFAPLEAMACGRPVIISDGIYFCDELSDGEGGLVFPRGNVDALAAAMRSLLESPARRDALARQAGERGRTFYNRRVAEALLQELSR
jgi:glycosyltransferase involved in cell wall biosynthesis